MELNDDAILAVLPPLPKVDTFTVSELKAFTKDDLIEKVMALQEIVVMSTKALEVTQETMLAIMNLIKQRGDDE